LHCIINIGVIFVIIQHDGWTLDLWKPYYPIYCTWSYKNCWMLGVPNQQPPSHISIHLKMIKYFSTTIASFHVNVKTRTFSITNFIIVNLYC
jgi:hypothetical protein